jgi:hypothetical protein
MIGGCGLVSSGSGRIGTYGVRFIFLLFFKHKLEAVFHVFVIYCAIVL